MQSTKLVFFIAAFLILAACKKDDGGDIVRVPPRDLAEVAAEDDADIQAYLATHTYNYEEFLEPPANFDYRIQIDTLAGENAGKEPLSAFVESVTISVSSDEFELSQDATVNHKLYYLVAREGIGESPTVADSVYVRYQGTLLDGNAFDGVLNIPNWIDLGAIQGPLRGVRGFSEGMPKLKAGGQVIENPDGTFTVEEYGVGMLIIPSGLAYYNDVRSVIPAYSPLIFRLDLFTFVTTDHDGDGIPSILEDVNGDGYLYNDNTDEQQERDAGGNFATLFVNFLDADDDNDNVLTRDEINLDEEGNLILPFPDGDGDGVPDHLDRDTP